MPWNTLSPYDYYQPEGLCALLLIPILPRIPHKRRIDKLRLSATMALVERCDRSSVSSIYGLGSPVDYKEMVISLRPGMEKDRDEVIHQLVDIHYDRNDMDFHRGTFRVRGDVLESFQRNLRIPARSGWNFSG